MLEIIDIEVGTKKAQLLKGHKTDVWQLRFSHEGKRKQITTKCKDVPSAKQFSAKYIIQALAKLDDGQSLVGTSFKALAKKFLEYETAVKAPVRNPRHVLNLHNILQTWLIPYFHDHANLSVENIRTKHLMNFLAWRMQQPKSPTQREGHPSSQTQKHYMHVMRRVMKYAVMQDVIETMPLIPEISLKKHRKAWFEPKEYKLLKEKSKERIKNALNVRVRQRREYLHNFIIFAVGCGARHSELMNLKHKNVEVVESGKESFVRLTVSGKTGSHEMSSLPSCRWAYANILKHNEKYGISSAHDDYVFPHDAHMALRELLKDANLYRDKQGRTRSGRNFRHTHIMFRLLNSENLRIKALADNLDTSVQTIDRHYAEISNRLNEPELISMKNATL